MLAAGLLYVVWGLGTLGFLVLSRTYWTGVRPTWRGATLGLLVLVTGIGLRQLRAWAPPLAGIWAAVSIYLLATEGPALPSLTGGATFDALVPVAVSVAIATHANMLPPKMFTREYRSDTWRGETAAATPYGSPYFWLLCALMVLLALTAVGVLAEISGRRAA